MTLKPLIKPVFTGRFEVRLGYDAADREEIERMTRVGEVIPERFVLVWVREPGQPWKRHTKGPLGSRAEGRRKLGEDGSPANEMGRHVSRLIYNPDLGELRSWATLLPGLRQAIEVAEENLPE